MQVKKYALRYIESKGSFQYCKEIIEAYRRRAEKMVDDIESQPETEGGGREGAIEMRKLLAGLVVR